MTNNKNKFDQTDLFNNKLFDNQSDIDQIQAQKKVAKDQLEEAQGNIEFERSQAKQIKENISQFETGAPTQQTQSQIKVAKEQLRETEKNIEFEKSQTKQIKRNISQFENERRTMINPSKEKLPEISKTIKDPFQKRKQNKW